MLNPYNLIGINYDYNSNMSLVYGIQEHYPPLQSNVR